MPRLRLEQVAVTYDTTPPVTALESVSATIEQGEFVAIEGPSGGGKSTLLNVLGLLHTPTGGRYLVDDVDTATLSQRERAQIRSAVFAFVFQSFYLLDRRRVIDSVELGMLYQGVPPAERRQRAQAALDQMGLADRADRRSGTLSGGERQRVAIARALAAGAPIVLADEPTGNLDSANGHAVMDALHTLNAQGVTVILVTHDPTVAAAAPRHLAIRDGRRVNLPEEQPQTPASLRPTASTPGRRSSERGTDLVRDALASVWSRRTRSLGLALAVAVATGLAVATFGLSSSAAAQVASTFNSHENSFVTATIQGKTDEQTTITGWQPASPAQERQRTRQIAGVQDAVVVESLGTQAETAAPWRDAGEGDVVRLSDGLDTAEPDIEWTHGAPADTNQAPGPGQALVGVHVADNLQLGPLEASPVVFVDGAPYLVIGIVRDGGQLPELTGSVALGPGEAQTAYVAQTTVLAHATTGAAQQIATQLSTAINPAEPDAVQVTAPADPRTLRSEIESDLRLAMLALTVATLLASVLSLANSMVSAVQERRSEFGLRRAVGASARHIIGLVVTESGLIAIVGALAGLVIGSYAVLAVTIVRHWSPVIDLRLIPITLAGGVVVGLLGGAFAARRAARIQPDEALRE